MEPAPRAIEIVAADATAAVGAEITCQGSVEPAVRARRTAELT